MSNVVKLVKEEIMRLEEMIKKIDEFLVNAPEGCLKWQNKKGETYYYHQFMMKEVSEVNENVFRDDSKENAVREDVKKKIPAKWKRKYIKKKDVALAKDLAQKQYYVTSRPIIEKNLHELKRFVERYQKDKLEEIYDDLSKERKNLITPLKINAEERVRQWKEEVYKKNNMYPEHLRYETEQGELVRSKSEVIIANILYQHRKDILYSYERPLEVMMDGRLKTIYPDFSILNVHTGKVTYWEHAGRMDDPYYAGEFVKKMNIYITNGLMPGRDVVLTFETQGNALDIGVVRRLIRTLI